MQFDVVIIGGGVLGISLAYHLSQMRVSCVVLEREATPAQHASGKNAGMIRQLYRHPQLTEWALRSIASWPDEIKSNYFRQTGSLVVGRTVPKHHPELFAARTQQLPTGELSAVYTETDGLLDSPGYVQALRKLADKRFATFCFNCCAQRIEHRQQRWTVSTSDGQSFTGAQLVNAAGAWVNNLVAEFPESAIAAQPYARHLFLMNNWSPRAALELSCDEFVPAAACGFYWDEHHEWYMRSWDQQARLVSVCEKIPASHPDSYVPDDSVRSQVASKLLQALPTAASKVRLARSWHCFRTYTDDQLPVWGPDRVLPDFFWLAAFGGFGMSTSFAATHDAAKFIAHGSPLGSADFAPDRAQPTVPRLQHAAS